MVRSALKNPYLVVVGILALLLIGGTILKRIPADILPMFKTPAVQVLTLYPGMPTTTVERDITNRLERWTDQANGVARIESKSLLGVSVIRDYFRPDIDPSAALSQVSSLATSDMYYLPPGTIPPMIMPFDPTASIPLAIVTVSSDTLSETQVYDVAYYNIRNMLSGITGVIAPAVMGGRIRRIYVYTDPNKLMGRGLSVLDVASALQKWTTLIPTGDAKIGSTDYFVITNGMVPTVDEINNFPLKIVDGAPVFVKDIGHAEDTYQIQTNIVHVNGRRQVYIPIYRQPGANSIQVVEGVKRAFSRIKARIPTAINLHLALDQTIYIRRSLSSLEKELMLGAALAALMVLLFLGSPRYTVVVFLTIPLSILAAVIGLYATSNTLNSMTLGGLALAVGRLVDDAIVVLENAVRHLRMGKGRVDAAREGAEEVAMPVIASTIATIVVFFPVVFLSGLGRFLFSPLALSVAFSMAASYVLAMTLIPAYCARFFHVEAESTGKRVAGLAKLSANFDKLQGVYERWLEMALVRPGWLLFGSGLVFLIALALYPLLGKELFPASDSGQFTVLVRAPSGTRIELTEQLVSRIENVVREVVSPQDLNTIVSNSGILYDWPAAYTPNAGPLDSFLNIQLSDNHRVSAQDYVLRLRQELAAKFPGVQFAFDTGGMLTAALSNGLPVPLDIQVTGNDLRVGQHIAREIEDRIHTVNGAVDVRIPEELDYPSINVNVDRVKAAYLGLDATDVVKNIVSALNSSVSFQPAFWIDEKNGNHYFLGVQDDQSARGLPSLSALQNIPLTDPKLQEGQEPTLVKNVATISRGVEPAEVQHRDIVRTTDVYAGVSARDLGSVATEIQQRIHGLHLPAGYTVDMRGEFESMQDSLGGLRFGLLMAVALIYLLLVAQFRSFLDPLIILFAVPLGLVGVIFTLLATGMTVNIQSYIGTIFMVGIAVSNSVLLVEFANRLRSGGMPVQQAVVQAGVIRLRPILMTSCAAMMGLLPMAFQIEPGGEANVPLARAVIGGLATSTLLTLFVVPSLYLVLKGRKH